MPTPKEGYTLKDGTRIPSVTTVLSRFKESGGLMHWAFEMGRSGAKSLYDEKQKAADVGTAAHAMVEAYIKGEPVENIGGYEGLSEQQAEMALQAFDSFLTWARHSKLEVVRTEVRLVSEVHRFGGTPDAIGLIEGEYCLLDWKTSNKVYADYWIQLAAYLQLWEENYFDMPLSGAHLIRFGKELGDFGHGYRPRIALDLEWRSFLLMRELYDLDKQLKKRAA